jgi:hypothetical protein
MSAANTIARKRSNVLKNIKSPLYRGFFYEGQQPAAKIKPIIFVTLKREKCYTHIF